MAKKEILNYGGMSEAAVNVHFSVGVGGDNGAADVMLIQALFHYFGHVKGRRMHYLGFQLNEIPAITGICDFKTQNAILKFQRKNANYLLSADGVIHPASYEGRRLKPVKERLMTITLMHFYSKEIQAYHQEPNYIDGLIKMVPQLRSWLS